MSRENDPYSSGQAPMPYRRASAQRVPMQDQERQAVPPSSVYASQPAGRNALGVDDLLWYGACVLLGLACIGTLGYWLWHIITHQIDGTRLVVLIIVLLIYTLCVGCGWLWGRYQYAPVQAALEQQIEDLQQQVELLRSEKQILQRTLRPQSSGSSLHVSEQTKAPERRQDSLLKQQPGPSDRPALPAASIYEQQIEPADSSDLLIHPHEKRFPMPDQQNGLDYNWRLIGASRRGYGHGYEGKYREDDFQIKVLNDPAAGPALALVAIADGLSSRDLARKGALASVKGATAITEQEVAQLKALLDRNNDPENLHIAAGNVLLQSLRSASAAVRSAARSARVPIDELHSTLLVFLAAPLGPEKLFLAMVQIGDGAIFGIRANANGDEPPNTRWKQLLAPQIQAAGNEVQPFMHSQEKDWYQFMRFDTLSAITAVMAMTDGIADDIEPPPPTPDEPEPDLFSRVDLFHKTYVLPTLKSPRPADELVKFIGYRRSQSIDDRTLVYLYHR